MRVRTRFALLFAGVGLAVVAVGAVAIYGAVGRDAARRLPSEAEAILGGAARRALDGSVPEGDRLERATESLIAARALLAEGRVLERDAIVRLALEVASILAAVLGAAAIAFFLLSRPVTRGLDQIAAQARSAQADRSRRFPPSRDPDLDAVSRALNDLLDLAAEQEGRLAEAARLEGWREVASFLAHQLKNPLAAARLAVGNARIALDRGDSALAAESADVARAEVDRLAALINRFRDLAPSGLESYGARGAADLAAVLADCATRAQMAGAVASVEGPASLMVAGDRGLLEQAFWNLFANSLEASPPGLARIRAEAAAAGREAVVLVADSGSGLDPALLPRLGRERTTTKAEGTGLGLILVRRILAAQGGSLELFATEAGGLGARVRLPLAGEGRAP